VDFLPPDGTPPGWERDGDPASYNSASLGGFQDDPSVFASNNLREMVVQYYRKGSIEVVVELAEFGSAANAEDVFNTLSAGKEVEVVLGEGTVVEPTQLFFFMRQYFVRVSSNEASEEINQTMAALAMTLWSYLE
jgi:hypothetical protein